MSPSGDDLEARDCAVTTLQLVLIEYSTFRTGTLTEICVKTMHAIGSIVDSGLDTALVWSRAWF